MYLAYKAFNNFRSKYFRRHFLPKISDHWNCFLSLPLCFTPCRNPTDRLFCLFLIPCPWKKAYWHLKGMSKMFLFISAFESSWRHGLSNYDLLYCYYVSLLIWGVLYIILWLIVFQCCSLRFLQTARNEDWSRIEIMLINKLFYISYGWSGIAYKL